MKIIDFILCDDIRREIGKKHTLVGVFDEEIELRIPAEEKNKWPKILRIAFFIRIMLEENDPIPDKFEIEIIYQGQVCGGGKGDIKIIGVRKSRVINFLLAHPQFPIMGLGEILFKIKFKKDGNLINTLSPDYKLNINVAEPEKV